MQFNVPQKCYEFKPNTELLKTCVNALKRTHFNMLFLMKLLFGFCLDFLLPKNLDNIGNLEITKKNYGNTVVSTRKVAERLTWMLCNSYRQVHSCQLSQNLRDVPKGSRKPALAHGIALIVPKKKITAGVATPQRKLLDY